MSISLFTSIIFLLASHEHVISSPVASANSPVDAETRGGAIYESTVNDVSSHCIDHFLTSYCGKDSSDEVLIPSEPQYEPEGEHTMILGTVCTETDSSLSQDEFVFSVVIIINTSFLHFNVLFIGQTCFCEET